MAPAFARAEVLALLEAETAGDAVGAQLAAAPLAEVRLASVLDHRQIVLLADGQDRVQVHGGTADVYRQDGRRAVGDRGLHLARVDEEGLRIGVDKDRQRVVHQDGVDRGDESVGRDDHLLARSDAEGTQRGHQRAGAVGRGHAVLGPGHTLVGLLELRNLLPAEPAPAMSPHHGRHRVLVQLLRTRPGGKRPGTDSLSAEDGGLAAVTFAASRTRNGNAHPYAGGRRGGHKTTTTQTLAHVHLLVSTTVVQIAPYARSTESSTMICVILLSFSDMTHPAQGCSGHAARRQKSRRRRIPQPRIPPPRNDRDRPTISGQGLPGPPFSHDRLQGSPPHGGCAMNAARRVFPWDAHFW